VDFSVFRRFSITERVGLEFRFESLNFFNTPHFDLPSTELTSPNFGKVTTALVGSPMSISARTSSCSR
jgi:hypothetical protein